MKCTNFGKMSDHLEDSLDFLKYLAENTNTSFKAEDDNHYASLNLTFEFSNKYGSSSAVLWCDDEDWYMRTDEDTFNVSLYDIDSVIDTVKKLPIKLKTKQTEKRKKELENDFKKINL